MTHRPQPKYASKTPGLGSTWTTCDDCGHIDNMRNMQFQYDYMGGSVPQNTGWLRCPRCITPLTYQRSLIVLPPDPPMVYNTRPENYTVDETNWLTTVDDSIYDTTGGDDYITSNPNPSQSANTTNLTASLSYPSGSVSVAYLDLFDGNPASGGVSILETITGSATRTSIASSLSTTTLNVAENPDYIIVTSSAVANANVSYVGIYSAASGGTLLVSGPVSATYPTIVEGAAVQFEQLALQINLS